MVVFDDEEERKQHVDFYEKTHLNKYWGRLFVTTKSSPLSLNCSQWQYDMRVEKSMDKFQTPFKKFQKTISRNQRG